MPPWGKVAALTAMQREAGTPEKQLQEQAITLVSGNELRALSMLIHTVYSDGVLRHISPAKISEAYRDVCVMQAD